jgi:hypothetical protein
VAPALCHSGRGSACAYCRRPPLSTGGAHYSACRWHVSSEELRSRNSSIILWRSFVMKRPPWGRSCMMPNYETAGLCHGGLKLPILRAALRSSGVIGNFFRAAIWPGNARCVDLRVVCSGGVLRRLASEARPLAVDAKIGRRFARRRPIEIYV